MKYNRKLRIVQVTPGLIQIPPNGWGAVEKMIWEYKLAYESLGYICDIKYLSDIKPGDYDMVHIHVANLALEAYENNIPYYFTMHDHHTIYFGKDSFAYKQNKEAIQKSIKSFVPAKYLLDFFDCKNLYYVPHGVNPDVFTYGNYTSEHKLLCVGNNGMINNPSIDRKGFIYAIEAARALNMDITIAGPENNKKFFKLNMDFKPYNKLNLVYNPTEEELINIYHSHTIFLHPSNLEAGQPNLTLMEALSCGLPIISTYEDEGLPGMRKIVRDTELIVNEIKDVINNYDYLKKIGVEYARNNTWVTSVSKILDLMNTKQTMEDQLITNYENTKIKHQPFKSKKNKILIDFVDGPKVEILGSISGTYNVKFIDNDSGKILYEDIIKNNFWTKCSVKHFINWKIEISGDDNLIHNYDATNKRIYICLDSKSLGDSIAWLPMVEEFGKIHNCKVICSTFFNELFTETYPTIEFVNPGTVVHNLYVMYTIGCFTDQRTPKDFRECNLQEICSSILGLPHKEITPKLIVKNVERPLKEKYVCISTASTAGCKHWQHLGGWQKVVDYLNNEGYKVIVIQKEDLNYMDLKGLKNVTHPQTKNLQEAMTWLNECEFYIGISSGVSWLAWALNKKVIMISGFTDKYNEFYTPYRIINKSVCNSCWNDKQFLFDAGDWNWCPKHKNTERQFECSKSITADMVIDEIKKIRQ